MSECRSNPDENSANMTVVQGSARPYVNGLVIAEVSRDAPAPKLAKARDQALRQQAALLELERLSVPVACRLADERAIVDKVLRKHGLPPTTNRATLARWRRKLVESKWDVACLLPRRTGPHGPRTSNAFLDIAQPALNDYDSPKGLSKVQCYRRFKLAVEAERARRDANGETSLPATPSFRWFRERISEIPQAQLDAHRKGHEYKRIKYQQTTGTIPRVGLLRLVELDHKLLKVHVREDDEKAECFRGELPLVLGRPWLASARDSFSKMPLGFYIGFEPPSIMTAMECLKHCVRHKDYIQEFPEFWKCQNAWPAHGKPFLLSVDQALENLSASMRYALGRAVIDIKHNVRRHPNQKPGIENWHKAVDRFTASLPGGFARDDDDVLIVDRDPLAEELLTVTELAQNLTRWIVDEYCQRPHEGLNNRTPYEVWKERAEADLIRMPDDPDELDYLFGEHEDCQLTPNHGIKTNNLEYNSGDLASILHRFGTPYTVHVASNRFNLGWITVFDPDDGTPIRAKAKAFDFANGLSQYRLDRLRADAARAKPGQSATIDEWERAEARRLGDLKAERGKRRALKRTHKHDARFQGYDSKALLERPVERIPHLPEPKVPQPHWNDATDIEPFDD